ncbi:MAG: alpha/beta hydrolase [Fimbriimonadaceae bacterium]|nr:alpha/beta hydrolase [Fimbriimonadaceae bacterium]
MFVVACFAGLLVALTTPQVAKSMSRKVTKTVTLDYLLTLPETYAKSKERFPLVLFLHGAGERGSDLEKVKVHGPTKEVANGRKFPFILVAPQCPEDQFWDVDALVGLLDEMEEKYRVDKDRIYVTGLSMGGYGTWNLACTIPDRIAAIAPICGGGQWVAAKRLIGIPIWAIHGDSDAVVPPINSEKMVEAVKAAGGDVRYTLVKGGGHDVWTEPYAGTELYDWLLSHKRKR